VNRLVDGEWVADEDLVSEETETLDRPESAFRDRIGPDGSFPAEAGRYHLYISRACPWAHRTAMIRALKGLDDAVSLSLVEPERAEDGWAFSDRYPDPLYGADYLRDLYVRADPDYTGRVTVPVLWDRKRETVVNNESVEIMRMLDVAGHDVADRDVDLYPERYRDEVDRLLEAVYAPINNGVYEVAYATTQAAYDAAVERLFDALDRYDARLADRRYLAGDRLTEADLAMVATLVRFDHVYHTAPETVPAISESVTDPRTDRWQRIADYDHLPDYLRDVYQTPGVAETVNLDHVVRHYGSPGSPPGFAPRPVDAVDLRLDAAHGRETLSDATFATRPRA
jgi:putative glutathione S-transferase